MPPPVPADAATEIAAIPPHEQWTEVRPEQAKLGRYTLFYEIGAGGMASVYLARDTGPAGFQRWVAVKRVHPHLAREPHFVEMFLDEARLAARISHANVTQVYDLGESDGSWYLAMEYLHGETLSALARALARAGQKLPWQVCARIISQVSEGLHYAHELTDDAGQPLGLVHRDVSPQNIIITYAGGVKVMDFGIAKAAGKTTQTATGMMKGKLSYMSPEQIRGRRSLDRRSDVFSLGIVLWELTMGRRLFKDETELDTVKRVSTADVPAPSSLGVELPEGLEKAVMRALALEREDRFATAAEMQRDLDTLLMRHGELVGAPELSALMKRTFADRIRVREGLLREANAPPGSVPIVVEVSSGESLSFGSLELGQSTVGSGVRPARRRWLLPVALITAGALAGGGAILAVGLGRGAFGGAPSPPAALVPKLDATERPDRPQPPPAAAPDTAGRTAPTPSTELPAPQPAAPAPPPTPSAPPAPIAEVPESREHRRRHRPPETTPIGGTGFVNVMTTPWSTVYLDGASIGPTPVVRRSVPAGAHSVKLVWADGRRATVRVTVRPGQTTSVVRGPP